MLRSILANLMISRSYARNIRKPNPGIMNRQELLRIGDEFEKFDFDDIDDFETDFANSGKVLVEKKREDLKLRNLTRLRIVRRKYFSEKLPNLLYWSEKEKIRHLYENEIGEWCYDSLAESFPATPDIIAKVVKSKWRPRSRDRIEAHDRNVQKNWIDFKAGKLNGLSDKFREHLAKFSERDRPATDTTTDKKVTITARVGRTEFRDIIRNYNRDLKLLQSKNDDAKSEREKESGEIHEDVQIARNEPLFEQTRHLNPHENTFVLRKNTSISNRAMTLDRLRANLTANEKHLSETDKEFVQQLNKTLQSQKKNSTKSEDEPEPETSPESQKMPVHVSNDNEQMIANTNAGSETGIEGNEQTFVTYESPRVIQSPNWIRIPRQKYKANATYKVHDSFYDSDGQFLYRVPGLK